MSAFWISPPKWLSILMCIGSLAWAMSAVGSAAEADATFSVRILAKQDDTGAAMPVTHQQVNLTMSIVGKRLKALGVSDSTMQEHGVDGFQIQMDHRDVKELERIRTSLERVAKLELREVSSRSDELGAGGATLAQRVLSGEELVPGYRAFTVTNKDENDKDVDRAILLSRRVAIGGADIAAATPSLQQVDAVAVTLTGKGGDKMISLTKNMKSGHDRIAILLDGEVISAPVVQSVPLGKNFIISGLGDPGEVQGIAFALRFPLENSIVVERVNASSTTKPSR